MSGDQYVERLERAAADLRARRSAAIDPNDAYRLSGKIEGVRLALSYLRDYPTKDAADAARLRSLAATFDAIPECTVTGAEVAAMLRDGGQ